MSDAFLALQNNWYLVIHLIQSREWFYQRFWGCISKQVLEIKLKSYFKLQTMIVHHIDGCGEYSLYLEENVI